MFNTKDRSGFNILISSDLEYEKNVIYLNFGNGQIATLSCDKGMAHAKIEIFSGYENKVSWTLSCQDFMTVLNSAYKELKLNIYEKNIIYLMFNNEKVAALSCDEEINNAKIEIFDSHSDKVSWSLDFQGFMNNLNISYEELKLNDY